MIAHSKVFVEFLAAQLLQVLRRFERSITGSVKITRKFVEHHSSDEETAIRLTADNLGLQIFEELVSHSATVIQENSGLWTSIQVQRFVHDINALKENHKFHAEINKQDKQQHPAITAKRFVPKKRHDTCE